MLDGLLGRGFASKCKSLIKLAKSRIDVVRRKRNATLKFLKKDMADLLASGLDINAFGRAEGLLAELTLSSCYDFIEQSCDFVLKHLSVMQKMRHCPEDCREAVSSLMFAAARFSDLPELRDLRDILYERYGSSLELFVSQEFVEKLSSKAVMKEKKLQLMQDIAAEFSIKWDSRTCEQRMSKAFLPAEVAQDRPKMHGLYNNSDNNYKSHNGKHGVLKENKQDGSCKGRLECSHDGYKESPFLRRNELNPQTDHEVPCNGYKAINVKEESICYEVPGNGNKAVNLKEETIRRRDGRGILVQGREETILEMREPCKEDASLKRPGSSSQRKRADSGSKLHDGRDNLLQKMPNTPPANAGLWTKPEENHQLAGSDGSKSNFANPCRDFQEEELKFKPFYNVTLPPPYTKPNAKAKDSNCGASVGSSHTDSERTTPTYKDPARNDRSNGSFGAEKIRREEFHHGSQNVVPSTENGHGLENNNHYQDNGISNPIPKPRSMRRRHSKSHSNHDDVSNMEEAAVPKRRSRSRRRDDSRRGLQILFDDEQYQKDDEERMIDKLLIHYSKKPSAHEPGKVRRKSRSRHSHHQGTEVDESPQHIDRDGSDEISGMYLPPRSISLPREQMASSEATKVFARAASFQADTARHVHPKLPDYDDLAARFAALKGR